MAETELRIRFKAILGIGGIIMLIATFAPWAKAGGASVRSFEEWAGRITFIGSWLMIVGSLISYEVFKSRTLGGLKPLSSSGLGIGGAILGLIGSFVFLADIPALYSPAWGVYLAIAGGFLGLFSAIRVYLEETGPTLRRRAGGL